MKEELQAFVEEVRERIEPHWSSDLLYEKFVPTPGAPASAGYCGPSSVFLLDELQKAFPREEFSLAVGRVYKGSKEWIHGKHVWVVWHQKLSTATIIDITADQSGKLATKVIVENIDDLARRGIHYIAYRLAQKMSDVDSSPKKRAKLLRKKLT